MNLGVDHLDFHGDTESYFAAKATLFESLGDDQWAVLPADSPDGAELAFVSDEKEAESADGKVRGVDAVADESEPEDSTS